MPVLITVTENNTKEYDCEVVFFVDEHHEYKITDLNIFESQFKSRIKKEARRCNCDTLFIDINDVFNMKDSEFIFGGCTSKKKFKEK